MLGSISWLGKRGYGMLYTAPATYMYFFVNDSTIPVPYLENISPGIATPLLLFLSLYAAIWMHRVGLLIFGDYSGLESSRDSTISRKHMVFFATGVEPKELPDTKSPWNLVKEAVFSDKTRWGVFLRFLPAGLFGFYQFTAWLWLSLLLFVGKGTLIAGGLWVVLSIQTFRKRIVGYLPSYIPPESIEGISEAEYVRVRRRIQQSNENSATRPRIKKGDSSEVDRRIR